MEGNQCYKFSTIARFVRETNSAPIELIVDIGANIGAVTNEMASYFPNAHIRAFEPVEEWFQLAKHNTAHLANVRVEQAAITPFDDVRLYKALPNSGPGWRGGSVISRPFSHDATRYQLCDCEFRVHSFDAVVTQLLQESGKNAVDLVKSDCEGSEIDFLGQADSSVLKRCRFIVGEYHGIRRFYEMCEHRLFQTHCVSLIGGASLGAFFAELKTDGPSILHKQPMAPIHYPHLAEIPLGWHLFDKSYIARGEELAHGYPAG